MELLQNFYETTLDALKEAKNERLWFKTNTKLGKLYFDRGDYQKLQKILKQLHQSCQVLEHVQLFLSSLVYLTVWSDTERETEHFVLTNRYKPRMLSDTVSVDPWIKVVINICVITCKLYILNLNLLIGTCIYKIYKIQVFSFKEIPLTPFKYSITRF